LADVRPLPLTEESLDTLAYIRQRFPYRRARGELRLFPPFHPPAGLVHPWMPKSFIYVQNRGNAIELDQTAPLTHLNIDYPRTAKTPYATSRAQAMADFKARWRAVN
jgi:hypothetical protein